MNAYAKTASALALACMGQKRTAQKVHVCRTVRLGTLTRYQVLVIPEGAEYGDYYEVGKGMLDALEMGMSPEFLELETMEQDDRDDHEDDLDYCHADDFPDLYRRERGM